MAIDKAIDSTAFDSKLTSVADAIRTAGGTTEPMSFPSGMVEAISAIQAGGGGGAVSGTLIPAEAAIQTITHNLGKKPQGAMIFAPELDFVNKKVNGVYMACGDLTAQKGAVYWTTLISGGGGGIDTFVSNCLIANANETTLQCAFFGPSVSMAFAHMIVGEEYRWWVW